MLLHAHHVYSMTGQRCSVLCYCVGTNKRNGFDVLTLYLPPNLHPTPHRTWRRVVASLLKPGSVFGVVAIGMGSAKLVEKLTRRLSNRTIREMSVESPNPMYGQHGRAMQANEGGMEAAARAVSTSFVSKSFLEGGGLNVEAAPRVVSAAFESSRVMPSATRVSGIKKKQIEWSPTAVSVRGLVSSTTPTTPSGSTSPAETKEATLRGVEKPEAAARDAGGGGGEDGINEGVESQRPDLMTGARGKVGVVEGSGRRPKSLQL